MLVKSLGPLRILNLYCWNRPQRRFCCCSILPHVLSGPLVLIRYRARLRYHNNAHQHGRRTWFSSRTDSPQSFPPERERLPKGGNDPARPTEHPNSNHRASTSLECSFARAGMQEQSMPLRRSSLMRARVQEASMRLGRAQSYSSSHI